MSHRDHTFSLRSPPAPDNIDLAGVGGGALDRHHHPAAASPSASTSSSYMELSTPRLFKSPRPGNRPVERVSVGQRTAGISLGNASTTTVAASSPYHAQPANQSARIGIAAWNRQIAYPLLNPQPGDRLVRLLGFNGNEFWVTMERDTDLGIESREHDGWAEAYVRSIPGFHDQRDEPAWSARWTPVIHALSGYRPVDELGPDDWTRILGPFARPLVRDGAAAAGDGDVAGTQDAAPQDEAVAPRSPTPAGDTAPATAPDHPEDDNGPRNPFHGVTAQTPTWTLKQIVQNENTLTPSRPSQTRKPAPIRLVARRPKRAGSARNNTGMRTGTFDVPCTHPGCPSGSDSPEGLKSHIRRHHQHGDAYAACLLCGKMVSNDADSCRRHRVGEDGCPQCETVVGAAGDYQVIGWRLLLDNPQKGPRIFESHQFGRQTRKMLEQWWAWEEEVEGPVWRWWRATRVGT